MLQPLPQSVRIGTIPHERLNVPRQPPHRDLICPTNSGIFSIEDFEIAQVGECGADFFMLSSFFEVNLPQTFDALTNRNIGLMLLTVLVAARVQCAVVGITPPIMSRHEDDLRLRNKLQRHRASIG
jgi:hypothetical protein